LAYPRERPADRRRVVRQVTAPTPSVDPNSQSDQGLEGAVATMLDWFDHEQDRLWSATLTAWSGGRQYGQGRADLVAAVANLDI
jgi:hypothetical protein